MTTASSEEYVTDVPYMRGFVRGPGASLTLRLVAALNGFPQPPADDFDYCELGSAHGDTTATLAAAYPRGPASSGSTSTPTTSRPPIASSLAAGLHNLRFLQRDFADLVRDDVPDLDFITAHGVLSWVGPGKRKAILDFASAKLKRGGLLYVSYNALPGWASIEPLRQLMLDRGAAVGGSSLERAREGLEFAKRRSATRARRTHRQPRREGDAHHDGAGVVCRTSCTSTCMRTGCRCTSRRSPPRWRRTTSTSSASSRSTSTTATSLSPRRSRACSRR